MSFPLSSWDMILLLAVTAIILLITSELVSPYYGTNLKIKVKRLRNVALVVSIVFLVAVAIRITEIMTAA